MNFNKNDFNKNNLNKMEALDVYWKRARITVVRDSVC